MRQKGLQTAQTEKAWSRVRLHASLAERQRSADPPPRPAPQAWRCLAPKPIRMLLRSQVLLQRLPLRLQELGLDMHRLRVLLPPLTSPAHHTRQLVDHLWRGHLESTTEAPTNCLAVQESTVLDMRRRVEPRMAVCRLLAISSHSKPLSTHPTRLRLRLISTLNKLRQSIQVTMPTRPPTDLRTHLLLRCKSALPR